MSGEEIPEPWYSRMKACGYMYRGKPSLRQLAEASGLAVMTVKRMIEGTGDPKPENVAKVSDALRGAPVEEWIGARQPMGELYSAPESSRYLTRRQRAAVTELINAFTAEVLSSPASDDEKTVIDLKQHLAGSETELRFAADAGGKAADHEPEDDYNQDPGNDEPA